MVEECNQLSFSSLSLISLWRLFSSQVIEDPFHPLLLLLLLYKLNKRTIRLNVNNKTVPILKGDKSRIAKWGIEKESIKLEAFENQQGVTHKKKSTWTIRNQRRRSVRRNPTVRLLARRHARWLALKKKKRRKLLLHFFYYSFWWKGNEITCEWSRCRTRTRDPTGRNRVCTLSNRQKSSLEVNRNHHDVESPVRIMQFIKNKKQNKTKVTLFCHCTVDFFSSWMILKIIELWNCFLTV